MPRVVYSPSDWNFAQSLDKDLTTLIIPFTSYYPPCHVLNRRTKNCSNLDKKINLSLEKTKKTNLDKNKANLGVP